MPPPHPKGESNMGNGYTTSDAFSVQAGIIRMIAARTSKGLTVAELRDKLPGYHHGSISGALSDAHRKGSLALLDEKRDGCRVYVHPLFVQDRPTRQHGRNHLEAITC